MKTEKVKRSFNSFLENSKLNFYKFLRSFRFESRTKSGRIFKFTFFFILYAAAIVGVVFGLINLGENNENKGLFGNTYNVSYKLDLPTGLTEQEAKDLTASATTKFTNYLLYKNVTTNNLTYEVKQDDAGDYQGYIYVSYTNVDTYYDDDFKNTDTSGYFEVDPNKYALDNESSSTTTVWYFNPAGTSIDSKYAYRDNLNGGELKSEVLSSSDFDYSSAKADTRDSGEDATDLNNYGVDLNLTGSSYEYLNDAGLETFRTEAEGDSGSTTDTTGDLQWIVFKNIDQLVNLLNYAKYVVFNYEFYYNSQRDNYSGSTQTKWKVYYDDLNSTDSSLVSWATTAVNYSGMSNVSLNSSVSAITPEYLIMCYEYALGNDTTTADTITSIANDGNSNLLDVMSDYVIGAVTKVNYKQWFPSVTSTSQNISGSSVSSFAIQPYAYESSSYTTASSSSDSDSDSSSDSSSSTSATTSQKEESRSSYIYLFKNATLPVEFYSMETTSSNPNQYGNTDQIYLEYEQGNASTPTDSVINESNNYLSNSKQSTSYYFGANTWVSNPYVETSVISTLSTYNSVFLASGVILLLIAIIVSLLYRIPGLMAGFTIIVSFGFAISLLIVLKIDISIPSILGLFVGTMLSVMSVSMVMERIRRLVLQKNSVFDSIQTGIKKSMLTTIDLNVTVMAIGLTIFFIAKGELTDMGITLLLSSLLSIGSVFVFFYLSLYAYSGFKFSWKLGKNFWHFDYKYKYRMRFNPKTWWIIWGVLILLIIIAAIVFGTVGLDNSIYKNGSLLYITLIGNTDNNLIATDKLIASVQSALGSDWTLSTRNVSEYVSAYSSASLDATGYYYIVIQGTSNNSYDLATITNKLTSVLNTYYANSNLVQDIINNISVTTVSQSLITKIFLRGVYALLAGYGFLCIYYAIRLNVLTIIPIFIASVVTVLVCVGLSYLVWFKIDLLFVYVMVYAGITTTLFSCLYISVAKTRFIRRRIFDAKKIQAFILNNSRSLLNVLYLTMATNIVIFALLAGLVSPTTVLLFIDIMIVTLLSIPLGLFLISHLYYYVILIRQKYVLNIINSFDNKINVEFKETDEQLIMGINKFH